MKKKLLSILLVFCLLLGCVPALTPTAAAAESEAQPAPSLNFQKTIAAGDMHMVVIKEDGSVWNWGYTEGGCLGIEEGAWTFNGTPDSVPEVYYRAEPVQVPLDKPVVSVSVDSHHTAVITADGELWNWGGHNAYGGLGREAEGKYIAPGKVMDHAKETASGNLHTAVLTDSGTLWTFGGNLNGQIGNGGKGELFEGLRVSYPYQRLPVPVLDNVKTVATGSDTTYAIRNDGSLWAWGNNKGGILGNGNVTFYEWSGEDEANKLLGEYHIVTYKNGEGGINYYMNPTGGLGYVKYSGGTREEKQFDQKTPIKIMDGVKQVRSASTQTLILKEDGTLWRTSTVSRSLGWDAEAHKSLYTFAPEQIPLDDVTAMDVGGLAYAAIRSDGSLWTWGDNLYGQLGRGKTTYGEVTNQGEVNWLETEVPAKVMEDVVDVAVGNGYIAALKSDGTLWMAGVNGLGQLGGATEEAQSYFFIKVMDGVALPASYTRNQQTIQHNTVPASFIETAPIQQEQVPVWDTTPWTNRTMSFPDFACQFNGNTYAFYAWQDCTWDQAENYCLSVGGHLATITSREEQEFVSWVGDPHWIGARRNPQGGWSWVTGESWGYSAWHPGQNDNYGGYEDTANVWGNGWNDVSNNVTGTAGFICEWETAGRQLPAPPAPTYSVTFLIPEGAQLNTWRKQVVQGQTYGWLPTPTMPDWNFVGWFTQEENGKLITPSAVVSLNDSQFLYAGWTPKTGGPSVPRLSYSFSNSSYDLNYPEGYAIPIDRYDYIFGNRDFSNSVYAEEWSGSCGGFCGTSTMLYMQNAGIDPGQFKSGAVLAGELKIGDRSNTLGMTLREWIETVQVSQSSTILQSQAARTSFDYNGLVQGVLNFRNNNTEPIIIWIWGPYGQGGHAVVGVGAWQKDDRTDCITVYDPNWPNTDRFIDLYRDSQGQYCGWHYDMGDKQWGSAYGNGVIQYVRYSDYMNVWNSRGTQAAISGSLTVNSTNASIYDYSGNLVATIRDGQVESLRSDVFPATDVPAGEGSRKDGVSLWIPNEHFMVINEDETISELEVRVSGTDSSVSVSTSSDQLLIYGGGEDSVVLVDGDSESYEITFTGKDGNKTLAGTTRAEIPTCFAQIGGVLSATDSRGQTGLEQTTVLDVMASTVAASVSSTFSDVPGGSYYAPAVQWALEKNVTDGTALGIFNPEGTCTRAEAVAFLWRAAGCPASGLEAMPFTDVQENDDFYQAVLWAAGSGITAGTGAARFSPDRTCSNWEFLTFLWRFLGSPGQGSELAAYEGAAAWADGQGLLKNTDIQADLNTPCLRCDAVTFLYRVLA